MKSILALGLLVFGFSAGAAPTFGFKYDSVRQIAANEFQVSGPTYFVGTTVYRIGKWPDVGFEASNNLCAKFGFKSAVSSSTGSATSNVMTFVMVNTDLVIESVHENENPGTNQIQFWEQLICSN